MSRRVLRTVIPVDDQWHAVELHGPILHVAARQPSYVEVWFLDDSAVVGMTRTFRVYGTGQSDVEGKHVGTALAASGQLVWHLFERTVTS